MSTDMNIESSFACATALQMTLAQAATTSPLLVFIYERSSDWMAILGNAVEVE
jgi:hypothetical protein